MDSKKSIFIGRKETTTLFKIFGFNTIVIDDFNEKEIFDQILNDKDNIGLILRTNQLAFSDKQNRIIFDLNIPIIEIPIADGESELQINDLQNLIEKAVGMKLDFLK